MKQTALASVLLGASLLLTGCVVAGSSASPPSGQPAAIELPPSPAFKIAEQLDVQVPSIVGLTDVTEDNDWSGRLGDPGQYTSATWIADSAGTPDTDSVAGGAVVEVFSSPDDAKARSEHVQRVIEANGPIASAEYHYLKDAVLLRVSGQLTPTAAKAYETAFGK